MKDVSRRAALVGATALVGTGVNLAVISSTRPEDMPAPCRPAEHPSLHLVEPEPDAELIRLHGELQRLWSEQCEINNNIDRGEVHDRYHALVDRLHRSACIPDDKKKWTEMHCRLHIAIHMEADKAVPEWEALQTRDQDSWTRLDECMQKICDLPALTIHGLAVKGAAADILWRRKIEMRFNDLDWEDRLIVDLLQAVSCAHYVGMVRREETRQQDEAVLARRA